MTDQTFKYESYKVWQIVTMEELERVFWKDNISYRDDNELWEVVDIDEWWVESDSLEDTVCVMTLDWNPTDNYEVVQIY